MLGGRPLLQPLGEVGCDVTQVAGDVVPGVGALDDERGALLYTPRKPGSAWASTNKRRVELLEADGQKVHVVRKRDCDLTDAQDVARLFGEVQPERVFHLAAEVGGIGANRDNPGRYWYANLMMGVNILEQARIHGTGKVTMV